MRAPHRWRRLRRATACALAVVAAVAMSGCDAAQGGIATQEGIPEEIKLLGVRDQTGPVAYAGIGGARGGELAISEINRSGFLGDGVKLTIEEIDTAGSIETASAEMAQATADRTVHAIMGPTQGQQAATVAPMVERAQVPTIFTQAGSDGVVVNDYTYRATAPMASYYDLATEYLADKRLGDVSVLYNATFPTFAEIGKGSLPKQAEQHGLDIISSTPVQSTTQDFTTPVRSIAGEDPDAVVMLLTEPQSVTALTQLRQAGYDGQVMATSVQGGGNLTEAGKHGEGVIYPTDFSPALTSEKARDFVAAFQERFGQKPDVYAAEGYDGMWWLARAIKASGSASREGIKRGLQQVAKEGFDGAMGELTFEGNDMRVPGVLVRWNGTSEELVSRGGAS
ncbi:MULTISPECIES: ABC transporter substrate-binding protein [Prauserella salsuginis group]|uniref:Branched-chain amino acid transport system substrate-binding protein n=2 Tax=Prauserella salsuginis group TaxID=2893672 RepID=A0A839XR34_9PSEU|nr:MULTISPECIES: ABC transporter substrate-binding protein [Prauserella salsuginis group]MBB3665191.1 branched-chain amino acid transport system substrate-binding protein [Prauserella sediminis]MCR3718655.1 branched-chain amino acid transport system substrate-binding protein [Prauserella flava]MCR3733225.1 branched-chain amino acid transport system substrate-binding protein [Prauserella salsuginis]